MSTLIDLRIEIGEDLQMVDVDRGVRVSTHCLFPSNSAVGVVVTRRGSKFRVDDDGAAIDELAQSVNTQQNLHNMIRGLVRHRGCSLTDQGEIMSPDISKQELRAAIILVANASKAAAEHLIANVRPPRRDLKRVIEEMLELKFKDRWRRNGKFSGASSKEHGFDYVVKLGGDRQLAMDLVLPDANSVNSAVVSHLDVKQKAAPNLEQRIVYDDTQTWRSEDIELLKVGARPVPLSMLRQYLDKLAA